MSCDWICISLGAASAWIGIPLGAGPRGVVLGILFIFRVVLLMLCCGCFICPFAVVELGLRYFNIISLLIFGHPLSKPFLVALNRVDILGLHSD